MVAQTDSLDELIQINSGRHVAIKAMDTKLARFSKVSKRSWMDNVLSEKKKCLNSTTDSTPMPFVYLRLETIMLTSTLRRERVMKNVVQEHCSLNLTASCGFSR